MTDRGPERLLDGGLAAAALAAVLALGVAVDARPVPAGAAVGAVGAALLEGVLAAHRERVRAVWERPAAKLGTLLGGLAVALLAATVAPDVGLSALAGGLATYLLGLGVVAIVGR